MSSKTKQTEAQAEYADFQNEVLDWYDIDATEQYVDLDQLALRTYILEAGAGDPILLLHGLGDVAITWSPLITRLQTDYSLYAPDRPGSGLSDRFSFKGINVRQHATDFVCSLLDVLEINRARIVASSAGGYFAFSAALDRPERVNKVVLTGMPLRTTPLEPVWRASPAIRNLLLVSGIPGLGKLYEFAQSRMDAETARDLYQNEFNADVSKYPDAYFEAYAIEAKLPGAAESFVSFFKNVLTLRGLSEQADLSDDLSSLEVPTLIIWGEHDVVPPEDGRETCASMPNTTFEVAEGSGHYPFNDVPDWTADRIREFLGED